MVRKINTRFSYMDLAKTRILREGWDVDRRLAELQLARPSLLRVRDQACGAAADATPNHPANAAGTFSYQHGTFGLREEFAGDDWVLDREDGIEAIRNDRLKTKVAFANVDVACDDAHDPKPRSRKGAGAERACSGNLLFDDLPKFAPMPKGDWMLFYLMVDQRGAAELSRTVVKNGTFATPVERIYLSKGDDLGAAVLPLHDDDAAGGFDPEVIRKIG
jgi:hypothetical protein